MISTRLGIRRRLPYLLVALGLANMAGDVSQWLPLRILGEASAASPLPLVFTDRDGMEDFASVFRVRALLRDGTRREVAVDREQFARLDGPLSRRTAYGAAIVYFPYYPRTVWEPVLRHGFCGGGPLAVVEGLGPSVASFAVIAATRTRGRSESWSAEVRCGGT